LCFQTRMPVVATPASLAAHLQVTASALPVAAPLATYLWDKGKTLTCVIQLSLECVCCKTLTGVIQLSLECV